MSRTIWVGAVAYDSKVVGIWEGMRRYFHEEARLSVEVVLFQSYEAQVAALLASCLASRCRASTSHYAELMRIIRNGSGESTPPLAAFRGGSAGPISLKW